LKNKEGKKMTKELFVKHIEETENLIRPSISGNKLAWIDAIKKHRNADCPLCKARKQTRNKNLWARSRHQAFLDCGLTRVKGALGGIYYE
jgi:hypothetical protein